MKEIEEYDAQRHNYALSKGDKITFITDDGVKYVFWDMEWFHYPVFSHREYRKKDNKIIDIRDSGGILQTDSRNYNLPNKIEEKLFDEYDGYYMADGKVRFDITHKSRRTVLRPLVGDMYPLREPE